MSFISKLIERAVATEVNGHVHSNKLGEPLQSAYQRLEQVFGLEGLVLSWFRSYLNERKQCIAIKQTISDAVCSIFGLPPGSVLGPLLFVLYTHPLGIITHRHGINIHMHTDDTQLYANMDLLHHRN